MATITRTITLEEERTVFVVGYGANGTDTNLDFTVDSVDASEPVVFSPGEALGTQMMIFGITTLSAGEHTITVNGTFDDITSGWIWILVGENTGQNTIGVND